MKHEKMVEHMMGSLIFVGDTDETAVVNLYNMAIVTSVEIFEEPKYCELGEGSAGQLLIQYPDKSEPELHDIHCIEGEDWQVDGYICTRKLDDEDDMDVIYMSEMLS